MQFKFENLVIWQKAMVHGEELNKLSDTFPVKERFNLSSQMSRSVDSIALNIADGSIGQSGKEFRRFVGYSIRSLAEVVTCLHKANNRNYISKNEFNQSYNDSYHLMNMMVAFRKSIN